MPSADNQTEETPAVRDRNRYACAVLRCLRSYDSLQKMAALEHRSCAGSYWCFATRDGNLGRKGRLQRLTAGLTHRHTVTKFTLIRRLEDGRNESPISIMY